MKAITNHHFCSHFDIFTTHWVNAGSSAPKLWNRSSNWGTTKISSIAVTTIATTTMAEG